MHSDDSRQLEQGLFIRRVIIVIGLTGLAVLIAEIEALAPGAFYRTFTAQANQAENAYGD